MRRTKEEWLALYSAADASGLSARQWCRENKIHPGAFSMAMHRLRKAGMDLPKTPPAKAERINAYHVLYANPIDGTPMHLYPPLVS